MNKNFCLKLYFRTDIHLGFHEKKKLKKWFKLPFYCILPREVPISRFSKKTHLILIWKNLYVYYNLFKRQIVHSFLLSWRNRFSKFLINSVKFTEFYIFAQILIYEVATEEKCIIKIIAENSYRGVDYTQIIVINQNYGYFRFRYAFSRSTFTHF